MKSAIDDDRKCRVCGCTDLRACPGGCWWVEWDLCSACRETAYAAGMPVSRRPWPESWAAHGYAPGPPTPEHRDDRFVFDDDDDFDGEV